MEDRQQLKTLVKEALMSNGILPKIKAQLMAGVFQVLQQQQQEEERSRQAKDYEFTLLDHLILAYLQQRKYLSFSYSVFSAETDLQNSNIYSKEIELLAKNLDTSPGQILVHILNDFIKTEEDLTGTTKVVKKNTLTEAEPNLVTVEDRLIPESKVDEIVTNIKEDTEIETERLEENEEEKEKPHEVQETNNDISLIKKGEDDYNFDFSDPESDYNGSNFSNFSDDFENKSRTSEKSLDLDFTAEEFEMKDDLIEDSDNYSDVTAHEELENMEGVEKISNIKL